MEMTAGGRHPEMGTHNLVLRLGADVFLEVIARDPLAEHVATPCWFGLGDMQAVERHWSAGRRLRAWIARTDDLDAVLADHGTLLGRATRVSRGARSWRFSVRDDGTLPADGAAPAAIEWGARGSPAPTMEDAGARLRAFVVEHPDPNAVSHLYRSIDVADAPRPNFGPALRFRATIAAADGERELW